MLGLSLLLVFALLALGSDEVLSTLASLCRYMFRRSADGILLCLLSNVAAVSLSTAKSTNIRRPFSKRVEDPVLAAPSSPRTPVVESLCETNAAAPLFASCMTAAAL